ncbi:MAG TPA: hypothetical protein VG916_14340 [Gemmatimonadaceae bacterium]|nr:hypothetical protein [Gemmatimonadaceae bacterium]
MPAATRTGIVLVTGGVAAAGAAYAAAAGLGTAPAWAPWLLAIGASGGSVGLFVLGAATRGTVTPRVTALLAGLFVVLVTSFGVALALGPREGPGGPLLLGLPLRLAVVFYGVGFVPLLALPLAYARTFPAARDGAAAAVPRDAGDDARGSSQHTDHA